MDININVKIDGLETLCESLSLLACGIGNAVDQYTPEKIKEGAKEKVVNELNESISYAISEEVSAPTIPTAPKESIATAPEIPTTEKTYSLDELSKAGVGLMDKGKQAELINLLQEFNVQAMPQLDKSQFGPFAMRLRELGADI